MPRAEPCDPSADARPTQYFRDASRAFAHAARATRPSSRTFRLGPRAVRIECSDAVVEACMTRAFAHLPNADGDADLNVLAFETARSGVELPKSPFAVADFRDHGELRVSGSIRAVFTLSPRALVMFDESSSRALWWAPSIDDVPDYDRAAPFRTIAHWWAQSAGAQLVHGAAVGTDAAGVLLAGPGGSGKSTTALACLGSGLRFAGDDYVLVEHEPEPRVHSIYSSAKLATDQLARFPHLRAHATCETTTANPSAKSIVYLQDHFAGELVSTMPLVAIVLPVVTNSPRPVMRRASSSQCLAALAPSTMFQHPDEGRDRTFRALASLAQAVPGYRLEVGPDLAAIPPMIEQILSRSTP